MKSIRKSDGINFLQQKAFLQQHFVYGKPVWNAFLNDSDNGSDNDALVKKI